MEISSGNTYTVHKRNKGENNQLTSLAPKIITSRYFYARDLSQGNRMGYYVGPTG